MALMKVLFAAAFTFFIFGESLAAIAAPESKQDANKQPDWKPATGPREFSVNVDDQIKGANQFRNEKWNNGSVVGSYAAPSRDGKWLKVNYEADGKGFRITKTELVDADKLMDGDKARDGTAHVDIKSDGKPTEYTISEDQLKKATDKNKENEAKEKVKQQ